MRQIESEENYEIWDFHTHPFLAGDQQTCMYPGYVTDMERFLEDMAQSHITRFAGSVILKEGADSTDFENIRRLNDAALTLRERYPDRYLPGFHVHPCFVKESLKEIRRMHREGVRLAGELVPYSMGWRRYDGEAMQELYQAMEEHGMVVSMHSMELESMERAVAANPGLTFVAAHPGQPDQVAFHIHMMQEYDNYYLDLSGTGLFRYGLLHHILACTGKNHLLFGTDYPITNPYMYVQGVLGERLPKEDNGLIFSGNARKLLCI